MKSSTEIGQGESSYRWVMLGLVWILYFSFGMVSSSMAPMLGIIRDDLGISDTLMGSALGAWPLVYIFFAIPAGAAIDRFGLRRSLAVAGLIIALSQVLRASSVDFATLFLAVAVFGLGGPLISIGAPTTVANWFNEKERATALGIYSTAPAVGGIVSLYTANAVVMPLVGDNWRYTLLVYGAMAVFAAVVWTLFARDRERSAEISHGGHRLSTSSLGMFPTLARLPVIQVIMVMSVGTFLFGHGFGNWLPELLRDGGMSRSEAGMWAALPTMIGIVGALTIPRYAARSSTRPFYILGTIFVLAAISALLVSLTSGAPQIAGLVLIGFGRSATNPLIMLILMSLPQVGARNMGSAGGLYFTTGEIGGVLGPTLVGVMADASGLTSGFLMLSSVSAVLAMLVVGLKISVARQAPVAPEPVPTGTTPG